MTNDTLTLVSQVMSNPTAYPDIFEAIFIALDLEPEDLEACAQVSRSWRSFVMDYLWQSARVNRHLDYKWSSKEPVCRSIQERNFARNNSAEVRCFSGYKNILLAGLYNGNIEVWRKGPITGSKILKKIATLRHGHHGSVYSVAANEKIIVSGSFDHSVCVWSMDTFELFAKLEDRHTDSVYGVTVNGDNRIVSCSLDSTVSVWQCNPELKQVEHIVALSGHVKGVKAVDCDEVRVVTASKDSFLRLWDIQTGDEISASAIKLLGSPSCICLSWPYVFVGLKSTNFSGEQLRYIVRAYNIHTGVCLRVMHGHEGRVMCVKYDPFSKRIVTGDEMGQVIVWRKLTGCERKTAHEEDDELPANAIDTGNSRVVGLLLSTSGFEVAIQKGHIMSLDFLGSSSYY